MPQGFSTSNGLAARVWAKRCEAEAFKKAVVSPFIGKTSSSLIQLRDELNKGPGDKLRITLRGQMDETVAPKQGNAGLEGNERSINYFYDDLTFDQVRDAHRLYDVIDPQRVSFDQRNEAKAALADLATSWLEQGFFNQAAGAVYADDSSTALTGNHTVPASESIFRPNSVSADESLGVADTFSIQALDTLIERAKTRTFAIRPADIEGIGKYYVLFLHPYQVSALRAVDSFWMTLNRDMLQSGRASDNPIYTGALGSYNGTLLVESTRVPLGVHSSTAASVANTRRAIFCGAQTAGLVIGRQGGEPDRFRWVEKHFDYDNELGISVGMVFGLKRFQFNSVDFGSIVVPTYAAASA